MSKDGFKLRTENTIQGIRYSSVKNKSKPELRMGSSNIPVNVVGVIFNPSNRQLECFNKKICEISMILIKMDMMDL